MPNRNSTEPIGVHKIGDPVTFLVGGDLQVVPHAQELHCAKCRNHVYIAPSGQARIKADPSIQVICIECFGKMKVDTTDILTPSRDEILSDLQG